MERSLGTLRRKIDRIWEKLSLREFYGEMLDKIFQLRRGCVLAVVSILAFTGLYLVHDSFNMEHGMENESKYIYISNLECNFGESVEKPDLRIIVIAYNRAESLQKLLNSLNSAVYFNDTIAVEVWLDRSRDVQNIHNDTHRTAVSFKFIHGYYSVHCHEKHVGIQGQWRNTWSPSNNSKEIVVFLEDDLNVSPYFYKWLKLVHGKYKHVTSINGFSLQGMQGRLADGGRGLVQAPESEVVFLHPILGCWGFSPKRENWFRCHNSKKNKKFQGLVAGIKPSKWYLDQPDTMWELWHIFCAFDSEEETLFGNFPDHKGLTINRKEKGLHFSGTEAQDPLLTEWRSEYEQLPDKPVHLDLDGNVVPTYDPFAYLHHK